jgi:hypothetical protein
MSQTEFQGSRYSEDLKKKAASKRRSLDKNVWNCSDPKLQAAGKTFPIL